MPTEKPEDLLSKGSATHSPLLRHVMLASWGSAPQHLVSSIRNMLCSMLLVLHCPQHVTPTVSLLTSLAPKSIRFCETECLQKQHTLTHTQKRLSVKRWPVILHVFLSVLFTKMTANPFFFSFESFHASQPSFTIHILSESSSSLLSHLLPSDTSFSKPKTLVVVWTWRMGLNSTRPSSGLEVHAMITALHGSTSRFTTRIPDDDTIR